MSTTRTRRSGITDSGGLNPSTIHLLPMARVKKELETRGLDTKGNGADLAFRLQEYVRLSGGFVSKFDPSPTTAETTTQHKKRKRKQVDTEVDENVSEIVEHEEDSSPVAAKPFHRFVWAMAPPTAPHPAKEAKRDELEEGEDEGVEQEMATQEQQKLPIGNKMGNELSPAAWEDEDEAIIFSQQQKQLSRTPTTKTPTPPVTDMSKVLNASVGGVDDILRKRRELRREKRRLQLKKEAEDKQKMESNREEEVKKQKEEKERTEVGIMQKEEKEGGGEEREQLMDEEDKQRKEAEEQAKKEQLKIRENEEATRRKEEDKQKKKRETEHEDGMRKKEEQHTARKKKEAEIVHKKKAEKGEMESRRKEEAQQKEQHSKKEEEQQRKKKVEEEELRRKIVALEERKKREKEHLLKGTARRVDEEEETQQPQKKTDGKCPQQSSSSATKIVTKTKLLSSVTSATTAASTVPPPPPPPSVHCVSLDILDSIMDSQQQLLTRKQKKDEDDERDEETPQRQQQKQQLKMEFLRRQQRMSVGVKQTTSSPPADVQKRRMSTSELLFGGPPPPPPPPPPKQQKMPVPSNESLKAPSSLVPSIRELEGAVPSSMTFVPLVTNLRDPLGLSSVGPDTPFPPPPPPPPPKKTSQPKTQASSVVIGLTSCASISAVTTSAVAMCMAPFPPPPPPPPRRPIGAIGTQQQTSNTTTLTMQPTTKSSCYSDVRVEHPSPTITTSTPTIATASPTAIATASQMVATTSAETASPTIATTSPTIATASPTILTASPTLAITLPTISTTSPTVATASPTLATTSAGITSPTIAIASPTTATASPKVATTSAAIASPTNGSESPLIATNQSTTSTTTEVEEVLETTTTTMDESAEVITRNVQKSLDEVLNELSCEGTYDEEDEEEEEEEEDPDAEESEEEGEDEEMDETILSVEDQEEATEQKANAEYRHLLKDPKSLLQKAQDVLRQKFGGGDAEINISSSSAHYEQVGLNVDEFKKETDDEDIRQLPDPEQFHGEPVPEDMDDDLFELAAGLPPRSKNKEQEPKPIEEEPLPDAEHVELDFYNSDLNMKASSDNKWLIDPDNGDGFALMWGGVRANWGVLVPEEEDQRAEMPPIAFQIKIEEFLSLKHLPFDEADPHQVRVGWSRAGTSNLLGEQPNSFAFCSMGNKATGNTFADFVDPFFVGEVITSVLDVGRAEIRYYKNGQPLGAAFTDIRYQTGDVYFPHIATKNCKVMVNFGGEIPEPTEAAKDESGLCLWSMPADEVPEETEWISNMDRNQMTPSRRPIADKAHCTIISMVGLPGVGKTTWVRQYLKEHPGENWILLNTDTILQAMTIDGMPRHRVHQGRWDMVMGLTAKALNRSLQMACRRRHNYILDQSNVFREARKRKLTQFQDFQRKCVVIIPSEAEHERRLIRQAREAGGGGQMPAEAMLEMKGQFSIPCTESEPVDDVIFVEPPIERINEAIEQVMRYNQEGRPWVRNFGHQRTRGPESLISDHSGLPAPRFLGVTRIGI